jgi:hypothetical protein
MYKKNPYLVEEALSGFAAAFELARKSGASVVYASSSSLYMATCRLIVRYDHSGRWLLH